MIYNHFIYIFYQACIEGASKLFATKDKKKRRKSKQAEEKDDEEPEVIDVLVDTLIGFLEKATSYMRTVANQSFGLLSGCAKESTIDLILTVSCVCLSLHLF